MILADHERCLTCGLRGKVIRSRLEAGYRRRRRQCPGCGAEWNTQESRVNVGKLLAELVRRKVKEATSPAPVAASAPPPPPSPPRQPARSRRRAPSRYLTG